MKNLKFVLNGLLIMGFLFFAIETDAQQGKDKKKKDIKGSKKEMAHKKDSLKDKKDKEIKMKKMKLKKRPKTRRMR